MKSDCVQCGKAFEHADIRPRSVCDGCRQNNRRDSKAQWRLSKRRLKLRAGQASRGAPGTLSQCEVARMLGVSLSTILRVEKQALEKVQKHRLSPELKEIWLQGIERNAAREPLPDGWTLVDYQLEVGEWWRVYDELFLLGKKEEALECLSEIERCDRMIKQAMDVKRET